MKTMLMTALVSLMSFQSAFGGSSSSAGVPNPASAYCESVGGEIVRYHEDRGVNSLCAFGRAMIGGWTLYYNSVAQVDPQPKAVVAFLNHGPFDAGSIGGGMGMPNPASVYCQQVGGALVLGTLDNGDQMGICQFDDNSSIDQWTLFRGPEDEDGAVLAQKLAR